MSKSKIAGPSAGGIAILIVLALVIILAGSFMDTGVPGETEPVIPAAPSLQDVAVTPKGEAQTIRPGPGYDGLSSVQIGGVPSESLTVTENGTYQPPVGSWYDSVTVNVKAATDPFFKPQVVGTALLVTVILTDASGGDMYATSITINGVEHELGKAWNFCFYINNNEETTVKLTGVATAYMGMASTNILHIADRGVDPVKKVEGSAEFIGEVLDETFRIPPATEISAYRCGIVITILADD